MWSIDILSRWFGCHNMAEFEANPTIWRTNFRHGQGRNDDIRYINPNRDKKRWHVLNPMKVCATEWIWVHWGYSWWWKVTAISHAFSGKRQAHYCTGVFQQPVLFIQTEGIFSISCSRHVQSFNIHTLWRYRVFIQLFGHAMWLKLFLEEVFILAEGQFCWNSVKINQSASDYRSYTPCPPRYDTV